MKLPARSHPLWVVIQQSLSLVGIGIWLWHGVEHHQGVMPDGTDLAGGSLLVKELIHLLKARAE